MMTFSILAYVYFVLFGLANAIQIISAIAATVIVMIAIPLWLYIKDEGKEEETKEFIKKIPLKTIFTMIILSFFIPDQSQMKTIVGAYAIESFSHVKGANELPQNVVNAMNQFLTDFADKNDKH